MEEKKQETFGESIKDSIRSVCSPGTILFFIILSLVTFPVSIIVVILFIVYHEKIDYFFADKHKEK